MDIRNYFNVLKKGKTSDESSSSKSSSKISLSKDKSKKKKRLIDSDDEDPRPPPKKKQSVVVLSESDEEIFPATPKSKSSAKKITPSKSVEKRKKEPVPAPKPLKECSASSFFSSAPASRSDAKATKERKEEKTDISVKRKFSNDESPVKKSSNVDKNFVHLDEHKSSKKPKSEEFEKKVKKETENDLSPNKPNENSPPNKSKQPSVDIKTELDTKLIRESPIKCNKTPKNSYKIPKVEKIQQEKDTNTTVKKEEAKQTPSKIRKSSVQSTEITPSKPEITPSKPEKTPSKPEKTSSKPEKTSSKPEKTSSKPEKTPKKTVAPSEDKEASEPKPEDSMEDTMEQLAERKKQKAMAYKNYLARAGPKNPGSKIVPEGAPGCLSGLVFVQSGVLESFDRTEMTEILQKFGAKVTGSISGKTTHLLLGDDGGQSKIAKAEKLGTKIVSEDDVLEMIGSSAGTEQSKSPTQSSNESSSTASKVQKTDNVNKTSTDSPKVKTLSASSPKITPSSLKKVSSMDSPLACASSQESTASTQPLSTQELTSRVSGDLMWVDKYKPATLKNIVGQQGDRSNAKKLLRWLQNWVDNNSGKKKLTRPSPWAKDDDGGFFKAALLSGPPGVGKTTTAQLVCKEMGYDTVELNASDTRSKRSLSEEVTQLVRNRSLSNFASGGESSSNGSTATSRHHVLLMDEVDGMAGNEDRGGVQELIQIIKSSKVPIICMCNDRYHQKIRSLVNYCFDLKFSKPRVEQIRSAMMSVCFREGIKLKPDALDQIIVGSNQDVRQVLHHLSMFSVKEQQLDSESVKRDAGKAKKDLKIGPWDVCRQVFNDSDRRNMNIHQKADLFFHDYSIGPLFVQENYWKARPKVAQSGKRSALLAQLAKAARSIADGDLVEKAIRNQNAWSLLPTQAVFSCVLPGEAMSGHLAGEIEFPSWLGNNSKKNKMDRLSQELHMHTRLKTSGNKTDMALEYCRSLRDTIVKPLLKDGMEGVPASVEAITDYCLLREDLDSLGELATWKGTVDTFAKVDSKVKAAFTRALNKSSAMTPYSVSAAPKKKRGGGGIEDSMGELEGEEEEEEEGDKDDVTSDAMIKVKKGSSAKASASKATKPKETSKGKKKK